MPLLRLPLLPPPRHAPAATTAVALRPTISKQPAFQHLGASIEQRRGGESLTCLRTVPPPSSLQDYVCYHGWSASSISRKSK